ncbi:hypothetical protein K402DRAFT_248005 [Aulographum hederae CBS 113979]|uniref:Uncharacterized protein n=1 Tax=Aulographum hederae CBS 113979 TaxID=1176131 RepID=A0A6G1HA45_9PEZI|nr:hypothetical protein K402DRAFT_248005 [Aulographum hederae CBS 113979]
MAVMQMKSISEVVERGRPRVTYGLPGLHWPFAQRDTSAGPRWPKRPKWPVVRRRITRAGLLLVGLAYLLHDDRDPVNVLTMPRHGMAAVRLVESASATCIQERPVRCEASRRSEALAASWTSVGPRYLRPTCYQTRTAVRADAPDEGTEVRIGSAQPRTAGAKVDVAGRREDVAECQRVTETKRECGSQVSCSSEGRCRYEAVGYEGYRGSVSSRRSLDVPGSQASNSSILRRLSRLWGSFTSLVRRAPYGTVPLKPTAWGLWCNVRRSCGWTL